MKIGILCTKKSETVAKLLDEGKKQGHEVRTIFLNKICIFLDENGVNRIFYGEKPLSGYDAIISRIPSEKSGLGSSILRQLELQGIPCFNSWVSTSRANDKFRTQQILSSKKVSMPRTFISNNPDLSKKMLEKIGTPCIIKFFNGLRGVGVMKVDTLNSAVSVLESIKLYDSNVLVQEYVKESEGRDIRCIVIGKKVVASMERNSFGQDFRANLSQGGSATKIILTEEEKKMAIKAATSLGLDISGVDLLRSKKGTMIIEVNASPGLVGIESSTGVDIKAKIFKFIVKEVKKKRKVIA